MYLGGALGRGMRRVQCIVIMLALLSNINVNVAQTISCPKDSYALVPNNGYNNGAGDVVQMCSGLCQVTASTESLYPAHQKSMISDGNYNTMGNTIEQGATKSSTPTNPQWFRIDLSRQQLISSVKIFKNEASGMDDGHLRIGNGNLWYENPIVGNFTGGNQDFQFDTLYAGRYIFMNLPLVTQSATLTITEIVAHRGCTWCPADRTSIRGSVSLSACICKPFFVSVAGGQCQACDEQNRLEAACNPCPANSYKTNMFSPCQKCPTNSTSPFGSLQETQCECNVGLFKSVNGTCLPCAPGLTLLNGICTSCAGGKFKAILGIYIYTYICIYI